jgi:hypothetical protein
MKKFYKIESITPCFKVKVTLFKEVIKTVDIAHGKEDSIEQREIKYDKTINNIILEFDHDPNDAEIKEQMEEYCK